MADMRRRNPEPPPGMPEIQFKPGMANELMAELAPLLAEEGIDVNNLDVDDIDTLQQAMNRAIERRNMELFTPVGEVRQIAVVTLWLIVEAILDGDSQLAGAIIDQIQPESPDNAVATVASCIGICLGLLDEWLTGQNPGCPEESRRPHRATQRPLDRRTGRDPRPRSRRQRPRVPLAAHPDRRPRQPTTTRRLSPRTRRHCRRLGLHRPDTTSRTDPNDHPLT